MVGIGFAEAVRGLGTFGTGAMARHLPFQGLVGAGRLFEELFFPVADKQYRAENIGATEGHQQTFKGGQTAPRVGISQTNQYAAD